MRSEEPETPGWETVIRVAFQSALQGVRTTLPGVITAYDEARQMASVRVMIQDVHVREDGETRAVDIPDIHSVPVMFLGPPRARVTWPVAVGDACVLWFSSSSLDQWLVRASSRPIDPRDARRHDLNDCIAMVGLHTPAAAPTSAPTDAIVVHCASGVVVKLGGPDADEDVVVQSALDDFMTALTAAISGAGSAAPALTSLQAQLNLLNASSGWKAGTSKVKAK